MNIEEMTEHKQYIPRKPFEARKIDPTGSTAFDEYLLCIDSVPVADVNEPQLEQDFVSVGEYKKQLKQRVQLLLATDTKANSWTLEEINEFAGAVVSIVLGEQ